MSLPLLVPAAAPGARSRPVARAPRALVRFVLLQALACAVTARAQSTPTPNAPDIEQTLPPVVVTATRTPQPVDSVLSSASLITGQDIAGHLGGDLADLLATQGGVEISRNGGLGEQTSVFMRGGNSNQTLVLVDGVPINTLNFGLPSINFLPQGQIDHIEVVRGDVSSLYGSNAIGGVIQIFSKSPGTGFHPFAGITAGSNDTSEARVGVQGGGDTLRAGFSVDQLHTAGINAINQAQLPGTNPDRDGFLNRSFSAQVRWQPIQDHSLTLLHLNSWGTQQYDSEFGPATQSDVSTFRMEQTSLVARDQWTPAWSSTLRASTQRDALDNAITAYPSFVSTTSNDLAWSHAFAVRQGQILSAALERLRQHLSSDTVYDRSGRTVDSARLGYEGRWDAWQLQANVRNDHYSDFGSATTGLLGLGWIVSDAWKWMATVSNGFRAPTFNDMFYPGYANPGLHPEHARSVEFGVQMTRAGWRVRSTLFRTNYRDLIQLDSNFIAQNIDRAHVQGWETTWSGSWRGLTPSGSLTVQDPRDDITHDRLPRRAYVQGSLGLDGRVEQWAWFVRWRVAADRQDDSSLGPRTLGGYALWDLGASRALTPTLTLRLNATNLTNKHYETVYGYRQLGRQLFVGLTWDD